MMTPYIMGNIGSCVRMLSDVDRYISASAAIFTPSFA